MKTCIGVALAGAALSFCLLGCAAPGDRDVHDPAWLAATIDRGADDPAHDCVDSALSTDLALVSFRLSHMSDEDIGGALVKSAANFGPSIVAMRRADAGDWNRSHSPSVTSGNHLVRCLADHAVVLSNAPILYSCFQATEPMTALEVSRFTGRSQSQAVSDTHALYGDFASGESGATAMADQVYSTPTEDLIVQKRGKILARCLTAPPFQGARS